MASAGVLGLLATGQQRRGQQQDDDFFWFHAVSLRKVAAVFNQTLQPANASRPPEMQIRAQKYRF